MFLIVARVQHLRGGREDEGGWGRRGGEEREDEGG
jgi:hypothetical protein